MSKFLGLKPYLDKHGLPHILTCPRTHQQNGSIQRKYRHIIDISPSLLLVLIFQMLFWSETFATVAYYDPNMTITITPPKRLSCFHLSFKFLFGELTFCTTLFN